MTNKNKNFINVVINQGCLGDHISCLPVVKYLSSKGLKIQLYTNYNSKFRNDNLIYCTELWDRVTSLYYYSNEFFDKCIFIKPMDQSNHFKRNIHFVSNAFESVSEFIESDYSLNYVKMNKNIKTNFDFIDKNSVIINTSYTENRKRIPDILLRKITKLVKQLNLTPVFVGKIQKSRLSYESGFNNVDTSTGINLIDKLTLSDLVYVLSKSKLVISQDGGIIHLAGMTNIPIFSFYTVVDPLTRLPIRNNIVGFLCKYYTPDISCKYCYTRIGNCEEFCKQTRSIDLPKCISSFNHEQIIESLHSFLKEI